MSHLSPSAQSLVRGAAKAARPSDADRARVLESLRGRLGDAAVLGGTGAVASKGTAGALWVKVSALTFGIGVVAYGLVVALRPAPLAMGAHTATSTVAVDVAPVASQDVPAPEPTGSPAPTTNATGETRTTNRRAPDHLAQEVALLSRATSDLRAGRASDALKALDEHQSKFPNGVLAEERSAARAQALCALGRRGEAEVELARLARTAPQSPQAARAREACGGGR
jgi:hypothetical protein